MSAVPGQLCSQCGRAKLETPRAAQRRENPNRQLAVVGHVERLFDSKLPVWDDGLLRSPLAFPEFVSCHTRLGWVLSKSLTMNGCGARHNGLG